MKHLLSALAVLLVTGAAGSAQERTRIYTRPAVPPEGVLNRLNLQLAWQTFVPSGGERDGINSIQVLNDMVLVEMRSGLLTALDPEDGSTKWRTHVGLPYRPLMPPGYSAQSVFVFSGGRLFSLERKTGAAQWDFDPPSYPTAAPAADNDRIYQTNAAGRLMVFGVPKATPSGTRPGVTETIPQPASTTPSSASATGSYAGSGQAAARLGPLAHVGNGRSSFQPPPLQALLLWEYRVESRLDQTPVLFGNLLAAADVNGVFFILDKVTHQKRFSVALGSEVAGPLGQHGPVAYVAARNFNLFALDIQAAQILWRFTADRPIRRKPVATDEEIYLAPERGGLYRIDRLTGQDTWRNLDVQQFLAENKAFIYALDPNGKLVLLDRARGTILASLDVHDFVIPVVNEVTDRLYLASNDGLIVCLHDRDYPRPWRSKTVAEEKVPPPAAPAAKPPAEIKPPETKPPAAKPAPPKADQKPAPDKADDKPKEK
jgi:outer membrane protein assembly factor BamB